jgi:hypothetical protein
VSGPGSTRYDDLVAAITDEFPRFRLVIKSTSALQRAIDRALRILTLGQMRAYLDGYQTTLGSTVYVTADWDQRDPDQRYATLRHELVHMRQFRRYGFLGMALLYLLVPLPMGLAYFRARFEREAYAETIRATFEVAGRAAVDEPAFRARMREQFTGPSYGWMWPFPRAFDRWFDRVVASLEA